jgi:hypothetical protein
MEQTVTTSITKGIVISLILIVVALLFYFLEIPAASPLQLINFVILIIGIIWSIIFYGKQINHNSTFGNYFAHGFKITALVTVIMILFVAVFIYIFPDIKEKALELVRNKISKNKEVSKEQMEASMNFMNKFFMVLVIGRTMLSYVIIGAIASLVGAAVTKKNPRPIEIDR